MGRRGRRPRRRGGRGLRSGGIRAAALSGAAAVYDDPAGLLADLDASPLVRTPAARPR